MAMDKRTKGFEAKHALDQETEFKINAKANKFLGVWVAESLGLGTADAEVYAKELVVLAVGNNDAVVEKIIDDLSNHGITINESEIAAKKTQFLDEAKEELN